MNINFIVNDSILVWNLLFGASITDAIYQLKQKIWDTYRSEYNDTFKDKSMIVKDYKNFIPNNDIVYNIVMESKEYERLKKQAEKYRIDVMRIWDKNKRENDYLIKKIIRMNIPSYTIFIVNKELGIIENVSEDKMILGKEIDKKNTMKFLIQINLEIIMSHLKRYKSEYEDFKRAILELAIVNEYATRVMGKSCYQYGDSHLRDLKRQIYPYWLMYLGVKKDEFFQYMMRDKIEFKADIYAYEKELQRMNLEEFIEFCIRNRKYIIREPIIQIEEVEEIL